MASEGEFEVRDPEFEAKIRESFTRQLVMETLGAELVRVEPGLVTIELPFRRELTQQHGFLHAGVVSTIVDSACGYCALSLAAPGTGVLTIENKLSLLAPARGERFEAVGRVVKPGRNVTFTSGEVWGVDGDERRLVATMTASIMCLADRDGIRG